MSNYHIPVMLKEVLDLLATKKGEWYIDCNLGGGGHTKEMLKLGGKVLGIDLDAESILEVAEQNNLKTENINGHLQSLSNNLILYQSNFIHLNEVVKKLNITDIAGILFDLGVSSHQLEQQERGFSFNLNAPLDMRMDQSMGLTAADLINALSEKELARLFWEYGEENFAKAIAKKIVQQRTLHKIDTTNTLAQIITSVRHRSRGDRTHPATRVFQALRIAVNNELDALEQTLPQALNILDSSGRLVIISFHSLEDRIVKNFMKEQEKNGAAAILTQKPIEPTAKEVELNPRSRSGKLRAIVKL